MQPDPVQTDLSSWPWTSPRIRGPRWSWAARQAELEATALIVLHVVHDPAASPGFYQTPDENWLRPMVDVADEMMKRFLTEEKAAHRDLPALTAASSRLVSGLPAGRIADVAAETSARLVVVGSRRANRIGLYSAGFGG